MWPNEFCWARTRWVYQFFYYLIFQNPVAGTAPPKTQSVRPSLLGTCRIWKLLIAQRVWKFDTDLYYIGSRRRKSFLPTVYCETVKKHHAEQADEWLGRWLTSSEGWNSSSHPKSKLTFRAISYSHVVSASIPWLWFPWTSANRNPSSFRSQGRLGMFLELLRDLTRMMKG